MRSLSRTHGIREHMEKHASHVHLRGTLVALRLLGAWQDAGRGRSEALVILIVVCGHQSVYGGQLGLMGVAVASMAVAMAVLCGERERGCSEWGF